MNDQQRQIAAPKSQRSEVRERVRAHHIQSLELAGLRGFHHLRRGQPSLGRDDAAPQPLETFACVRVVDVGVARQAVRQNSHIGSAARIRVIAERHVANFAGKLRAKRNQLRDRRAGNFRAKHNRDVRLRLPVAALSSTSCSTSSGRKLTLFMRQPAKCCDFLARQQP